jgi:two-component system cell cycle response regulator
MTERSSTFPKVLAIDDSVLIHRLLQVRLQHEEIQLFGATSADMGIKMARELRPDVVLLDIELDLKGQGMDGFGVLQVFKDDPDLQDVSVIFISSTSTMEERVRALDMGASDFVAKPFEIVELQARVRSALRVQKLVRMLAQKAQVDGLTGLWNRTYFDRRLSQEMGEAVRHGRSLSLVMCDVDRFKKLNDERGHPFGDKVLERLARIFQTGRGSDIACRWGGEEFGIILPNTVGSEAIEVADRYRRAIEQEVWPSVPGMVITASFGVADVLVLPNTPTTEDLVLAADAALYQAKMNGRNRVEAAVAAHLPG